MHIVMSCIVPLFPDYVMGGAQKHLKYIAIYLAEMGHEVTIICTWREDTPRPFKWHDRVTVHPVMRFHQPFPQPYATSAHNIAMAIQDIGELLQTADRFYMHDGEILFPYVYQQIPTVISLRDNVYPETLIGGFLFQGYKLIVISHYAEVYFAQTVGRFFPEFSERIRVIRNGLDWEQYRPVKPGRILDLIPVDPENDLIVLHPHRPEESKGLWQTIAIAEQLVHRYKLDAVKVAVPRWIGTAQDSSVQEFYERAEAEIARRGLTDHFVFHEWVPYDLLPEYYSLGHVSLSPGNFVESFGNAVYESLGCGTPSVVARISSHREILPEHLIDKVDFGDIDTAAEITADILKQKRRTSPETLAYLHEHFSGEKQLAAYAETILNAEVPQSMRYRFSPIDDRTTFQLPIWCYEGKQGFYHDFRADYRYIPELSQLIKAHPDGFTFADAEANHINREIVNTWYREGYLTPVVLSVTQQ